MRKNVEISDEKINEFLEQFYGYFESGYAFEEFVEADASRPIILIDGKALVESCIDNEIGFVFTHVFSKNAMDVLKDESDDLLQTSDHIMKKCSLYLKKCNPFPNAGIFFET